MAASQRKNTIAIACGDAKRPALFFDEVIPLTARGEVPTEVQREEWIEELGELADPRPIIKSTLDGLKARKSEVTTETVYLVDNRWARLIRNAYEEKGVPSVPFFHDFQQYSEFQTTGNCPAIEVRVDNISVIETEKLQWEQILEIRQDKDSIVKLRRFRLFITDNYEDKDESYIRDDLLRKIDDYESSCKKHGIDLTLSTISRVLDSKSLLGALGVSAAAILCGLSDVASAGLIGGATIEIGKAAIHIAQKSSDFRAKLDGSEIAYLMEIKDKANSE